MRKSEYPQDLDSSLCWQTKITQAQIHKTLLRGLPWSFFGGAFLLTASFLPLSLLERWGWLLFLLAFAAIAKGVLPSRKLRRLQQHPNFLYLTEESLILMQKGHPPVLCPLREIEEIQWTGRGLRILRKNAPPFCLPYFDRELKDLLATHRGGAAARPTSLCREPAEL